MSQRRALTLLQITLVVHDLESTLREFERVLGLRVAFRDPGVALWGLENAVLPMGATFIEVLSPIRPDTPGGRQLARMGGDGGYMVILQVDDLEPWRVAVSQCGVRVAWQGETTDPIHETAWAGLHLDPRDTGGMMISLDRPDPPDSWAGAGPHWRDFVVQDVVDELAGIQIMSPDPDGLARRWSEILARDLEPRSILHLDRGELAFAPTRDGQVEGLKSISLHARDRNRVGEAHRLGGVDFELV
jgi:catechol 2,3-dioxygenase-like lactoylglutathione lyase family enzyme